MLTIALEGDVENAAMGRYMGLATRTGAETTRETQRCQSHSGRSILMPGFQVGHERYLLFSFLPHTTQDATLAHLFGIRRVGKSRGVEAERVRGKGLLAYSDVMQLPRDLLEDSDASGVAGETYMLAVRGVRLGGDGY